MPRLLTATVLDHSKFHSIIVFQDDLSQACTGDGVSLVATSGNDVGIRVIREVMRNARTEVTNLY